MSSHSPEEATRVVSGVKLDDLEELGFGMRQPKRKPFRLNPFLASRPKSFLVARPKTLLNPMTRLLHVRNFEISNSHAEDKSYSADGEAGPYPTDQTKKTPR